MTAATTPSRQAASRVGQHLKSGVTDYIDHWQEWIVPTLVAAAYIFVSILCCWFPYLFVLGPITCGMYCCALKARRGGTIDVSDLNRGWRTPGRSMLAALIINFGMALPMFLLYGLMFACFGLFVALAPQSTGAGPNRMEFQPHQQSVDDVGETDVPPTISADDDVAAEATSGDAPERVEQFAPQQPQDSQGQRGDQAEEPPPEFIFGMIAGIFVFYALLFLAIILCWLWMLWFGTRTMFVFPLIAERRLGFTAAWSESWRETRVRFWELLLLNFVAGLLGMLGIYAMYIGLIFTMPIMFSIIISVYDERFPAQPEPVPKKPIEGD